MCATLKTIKPLLKDNEVIELGFQNSGQLEEYILRIKPTLLSELRDTLNNQYIELFESVLELENLEKPKLYNDKEKLQLMIEKNPALQILKNKFNLDFD